MSRLSWTTFHPRAALFCGLLALACYLGGLAPLGWIALALGVAVLISPRYPLK